MVQKMKSRRHSHRNKNIYGFSLHSSIFYFPSFIWLVIERQMKKKCVEFSCYSCTLNTRCMCGVWFCSCRKKEKMQIKISKVITNCCVWICEIVAFKLHVARHLCANIHMCWWLMKIRTENPIGRYRKHTLHKLKIQTNYSQCTKQINRIGFKLRKSNKTIECTDGRTATIWICRNAKHVNATQASNN